MTGTATAQAAHWYGLGLAHAWGGITTDETTYFIDWLSDTIKVSLHTSTYTPNMDTHDFYDDITNEVTGAAYTAGGATLASKALAYASNVIKFSAANVTWSGTVASTSPNCACYAVIYKAGDTAAHSPLIGYVDWANSTAGYSVTTGTFNIIWAAAGILTITIGT